MKLTIERLGHHGDGIAEGPIFVPLTLPGELVEGDVENDRMDKPRILTPSDNRVRPPCSHFKSCGGCGLQHAADPFVAEWKQTVVRKALQAQGIEASFREIAISPPKSRRRATLSARRGKSAPIIGFHARGSDVLIGLNQCSVLHPDIFAMKDKLGPLVVHGASRKGEISLQMTLTDGGIDLSVQNAKPFEGAEFAALAQFADQLDLARLTWNGELVVERRTPLVQFGAAHVPLPAGAFLQATEHGENALVQAMLEATKGASRLIDLFSGCGTFTLPLALHAEIHAVEGDADMLKALDAGWRKAKGLKTVTTERRDLFRRPLQPDELKRFDAAVIDPPRAGADAQIAELARCAVAVIGAVSCNPVTFARDARVLLAAGFKLDWVQVVDQFRWSPHVEIAARFTR